MPHTKRATEKARAEARNQAAVTQRQDLVAQYQELKAQYQDLAAQHKDLVAKYYFVQANFHAKTDECTQLHAIIHAKQHAITDLLLHYPLPPASALQAEIDLAYLPAA